MKRLIQIVLVAAAALTARAQGTTEAITGYANAISGIFNGTAGWSFQAQTDLDLTSLGCFSYVIANQGPVVVGLWSDAGLLLASNALNSSSSLVNQSRYAPVTPVHLVPSQIYHLGVYSASGQVILDANGSGIGGSVQNSPDILIRGATQNASGWGFPPEAAGGSGVILYGPNFLFNRSVPEPGVLALMSLGGALLAVRFRREGR